MSEQQRSIITVIMNHNMKKVCFLGVSLATYNMGVSALTASLVKITRYFLPEAEFFLLIGNRSSSAQILTSADDKKTLIQVINYRLSPKAKIKEHLIWIFLMACMHRIIPLKVVRNAIVRKTPFLNTLAQADFVGDIRGGDSFSDIYGLTRLVIGSTPAIIALLMKKKLILLPQTYGPYETMAGRAIGRYIIQRSAHILSRDKEGISVLKKLMDNKPLKQDVLFCPDVAFMLDSRRPGKLDIEPRLLSDKSVPLIGLNINGLMYNGGYTRNNMFGLKMDYRDFAAKIALTLLEKTSAHLLFVPHTYNPAVESDPDACRDIMNSLSGRYGDRMHLVVREYDQSEIKGVIDLCDFFIGSRMHACIAAISQEIPTVGIAYSRKFHGVFESVGVGEMIVDGRSMNTDEAVEHVMKCYQNRDEMKSKLRVTIGNAKQSIMATFKDILAV